MCEPKSRPTPNKQFCETGYCVEGQVYQDDGTCKNCETGKLPNADYTKCEQIKCYKNQILKEDGKCH